MRTSVILGAFMLLAWSIADSEAFFFKKNKQSKAAQEQEALEVCIYSFLELQNHLLWLKILNCVFHRMRTIRTTSSRTSSLMDFSRDF